MVHYKVYPLGADFPDDQFEEVWRRMCSADFLVWGTPVYWHSMSGALKVVVDRMYDKRGGELEGKPFAFFQQGGSPPHRPGARLVRDDHRAHRRALRPRPGGNLQLRLRDLRPARGHTDAAGITTGGAEESALVEFFGRTL